ncbi:hypothetical protein FHS78_000461 [Parvibaculum indicum]|uniref:PilZ domain-containing protein n=1 Tax=Parvibaculum indicum TaxID=562969 RepID=UPI00142334AF|nr:PilZ domain-containing protein [Parvibaculum indicum]NIJ40206.1 hypothetical protein [Parvibaculum indicum]
MATEAHEERRRYERVAIKANGRFLAPDGTEHQCTLRDMSLGGLGISSDYDAHPGDRIIIYLDNFGRFEGNIVRTFEGGFAIETVINGPRRERIQERLASYARGDTDAATSRRTSQRYAAGEAGVDTRSMLQIDGAEPIECRIIDMSLGGAQVEIQNRPPIGTPVMLGRMKGRVVRHTDEGIGIQFIDVPEHASALSRPFG